MGTFSCHAFRLNLVAAPGAAAGGNIEFWGSWGQRMPAMAFVGTGAYDAPPGACTGTVDLLRGLDFARSTMDSDVTPPVPLCRNLGGAMGATANADCAD